VAVRLCLEQLSDPRFGCQQAAAELEGIGFKAATPARWPAPFAG